MSQAPSPDVTLSALWPLLRPASLAVTVVACVLGLASAAACGHGPDWAGALAVLLLASGFHASANLLQASQPASSRGLAPVEALGGCPNALVGAWVPPQQRQQVRQFAWALLGLVLLAGTWLALRTGGGLMILGVAALALLWASTQAPLHLGQRSLGTLAAALGWWLAVLGADYVQRRHFFVIPAATAASFALLVANTQLICALATRPASDLTACRRHLTDWGARPLGLLYGVLALAAHGWLAAGVWALVQPETALWGLVSLPLSVAAWAGLWRALGHPGAHWLRVRRLSSAAALVHGLAMAAGLAVGAPG